MTTSKPKKLAKKVAKAVKKDIKKEVKKSASELLPAASSAIVEAKAVKQAARAVNRAAKKVGFKANVQAIAKSANRKKAVANKALKIAGILNNTLPSKSINPLQQGTVNPRAQPGQQKITKKNSGMAESIGSGIGSAIGSIFGPVGTGIGGHLGSAAGSLFKSITGWGDYRARAAKHGGSFSKAVAMGTYNGMGSKHMGNAYMGSGPARFTSATGVPHITKTEFLGDVKSSIDFNSTLYEVNPGLKATFPWGSGVAQNFQQWVPVGMECFCETTASNVSATTNTALGIVIMSSQYNFSSPPLDTVQEAENNEYTTQSVPTKSFYHPIECDPNLNMLNVLNVRDASKPQTQFTDRCNTYVITEGMQADGVVIGRIWVTYHFVLLKPQQPQSESNFYYGGGVCLNNYSSVPVFLQWTPTIERNTFLSKPTATINGAGDLHITLGNDSVGTYLVSVTLVSTQTNAIHITGANIFSTSDSVNQADPSFYDELGVLHSNQMVIKYDPSITTTLRQYIAQCIVTVGETGGMIAISSGFNCNGAASGFQPYFTVFVDQIAPASVLSFDRVSVLERKLEALTTTSVKQVETIPEIIQRMCAYYKKQIPPVVKRVSQLRRVKIFKDEYHKLATLGQIEDEFAPAATSFNLNQCKRCKRLSEGEPCQPLCECHCHDVEEKEIKTENIIHLEDDDGVHSFDSTPTSATSTLTLNDAVKGVPVLKLPPPPRIAWQSKVVKS